MRNTATQRGRELVDEYTENYGRVGDDELEMAVCLITDVLAYLDEAGADVDYVLEQVGVA